MQWIAAACRKFGAIKAIGVGSFGPVELGRDSGMFGYITTTPKPGWQHVPLVDTLHSRFQVPVGFDTDVNAAAMGEQLWGAGQGMDPLVYNHHRHRSGRGCDGEWQAFAWFAAS